jgi:hypothetical protein
MSERLRLNGSRAQIGRPTRRSRSTVGKSSAGVHASTACSLPSFCVIPFARARRDAFIKDPEYRPFAEARMKEIQNRFYAIKTTQTWRAPSPTSRRPSSSAALGPALMPAHDFGCGLTSPPVRTGPLFPLYFFVSALSGKREY